MDTTAACYIGSAVAKAQLDIAVRPRGEQWTAPHDEAGLRTLVARLQALRAALGERVPGERGTGDG